MTPDERAYRPDPRLVSLAEEAGAAACRAGLPREAVPCTFGDAGTDALSDDTCEELARSWLWGWRCADVLSTVSERMFPASFPRPTMG